MTWRSRSLLPRSSVDGLGMILSLCPNLSERSHVAGVDLLFRLVRVDDGQRLLRAVCFVVCCLFVSFPFFVSFLFGNRFVFVIDDANRIRLALSTAAFARRLCVLWSRRCTATTTAWLASRRA